MARVPGGRRQQKQDEDRKRYEAPTKEVDPLKIALSYKKKAVARMKGFYEQSQKMDTKLAEMLEAAAASGIIIDKLTMNSYDEACLLNYRKRSKGVVIAVEAHKDEYTFAGQLTISPASMKLILNAPGLKRITAKNGWHTLNHYQLSYYKTLVKSDNYLPALVAGRERDFETYRYNKRGMPTCDLAEVKEVKRPWSDLGF